MARGFDITAHGQFLAWKTGLKSRRPHLRAANAKVAAVRRQAHRELPDHGPASKSPLVSPAAIAICKADIRAFFSRFTQGASAKTVWGSMRAEQVSIAQRWRRPRSDPEYTERRSDTGKITEKCSNE